MGKAKKIMFQGTGSSVGKSLVAAAVCRILNNKGLRVMPYKAQNMALNSYITADGKEMGRAQVTQAECARVEPDVAMNPVLLKPNSDVGSQVIINGVAAFNMDASEYHKYKAQLVDVVKTAYEKLADDSDVVVIEGAGSPAEINLRDNDIVNMGLAEMIDAPVVLIGDIDRGGVFASIYGTIKLLEPEEQALIKGFIINKFRGDVELLKPGIDMIEEKVGVPCLGVIPYTRLVIDDEDSVTERWHEKKEGAVTIGVVRLRHISNFTDCTVFDMYPDVKVEYYANQREMQRAEPDLLVVPGSKNTIDDMTKLREARMDQEILRFHRQGIPVIGVCGGYQIIGKTIADPDHMESAEELTEGLGLLDVTTVLEDTKTTTRKTGTIQNDFWGIPMKDTKVSGYEIHMGRTSVNEDSVPFSILDDGRSDGAVSKDGMVMGTYLHGIFDNDEFREALLSRLKEGKNLESSGIKDFKAFKESQYDLLAETVEKSLDMDKLMSIIG